MRDTRKKLAALARALSEAERERLVRLYTRGKLTDDEYDAYSAEMVKRKELTETEAAIRSARALCREPIPTVSAM
jgi:hypothetical protein